MTYRWEPTTPLDRILATGFKRIDEAVEVVIAKHGESRTTVHIDRPDLEDYWHNAQKNYNYHITEMARRQGEGLQNAYWHQEQLLNRAGQNMLSDPNHCSAGMQGAMGQNTLGGLIGDPDYQSWLTGRQGL